MLFISGRVVSYLYVSILRKGALTQDKAVGGISLFSILLVLSCGRQRCWERSYSRVKLTEITSVKPENAYK